MATELNGVSFQGRSLKLDTSEDAKEIIDAINACSRLEYLNLEGNTLGVEAAKAISVALQNRPELKHALWKDMFTGRMKDEIPVALKYLCDAMTQAGAKLSVLDLSDNAFGPIGLQGLAAFLKSPSCYQLQQLKLNNNGLGITGGKILAKALTECYDESQTDGEPFALKVVILGRNRLENEGAKALAGVFAKIGSLEEVQMPQNGIFPPGIAALSNAFENNKNLQRINLNDNTVKPEGAASIARALKNLPDLRNIDLGDCLLKTKGAISLANALGEKHARLESVLLEGNEINRDGGMALAKAVHNKPHLKNLSLNCNMFGEDGRAELQNYLKRVGKLNNLQSLSDDESDDGESDGDDDDDDDDDNDEDNASENDSASSDGEEERVEITIAPKNDMKLPDFNDLKINNLFGDVSITKVDTTSKLAAFLDEPTVTNYLNLGSDKNNLLLNEIRRQFQSNRNALNTNLSLLMKISQLSDNTAISNDILKTTDLIYEELTRYAQQHNRVTDLNNSLMGYLGLLKLEDRVNVTWKLPGCFRALQTIATRDYFPESTRQTLQMFGKL